MYREFFLRGPLLRRAWAFFGLTLNILQIMFRVWNSKRMNFCARHNSNP